MTTVFSGVPIGERIGTRLGCSSRKSSLSASLVDSPTGFAIATPIGCF